MPQYRVTDPNTGKTLTLTGDSPPTEAELEEVFSQHQAQQKQPGTVEIRFPQPGAADTEPAVPSMPLTGRGGAIRPSLWQTIQTTAPMPGITGAMDVGHGAAQLVEQGLGSLTGNPTIKADAQRNLAAMAEREREYQLARRVTGADQIPDVGRGIGNIAATMYALGGGRALASAPGRAVALPGRAVTQAAATLPARMAQGAGAGAVSGALTPVTDESKPYWEQKAWQTGTGAVIGGAVPLAGEALGRIISPRASTDPEVQMLLRRGVRLTPGQMAGGFAKSTEDQLRSVPITGQMIAAGQKTSFRDFHHAAVNEALAPIGRNLPADIPLGHRAVQYAYDALGRAYDAVTPHLSLPTAGFDTNMANVASQAATDNVLTAAGRRQLVSILKGQISKLNPANPTIDGETIKGIDSVLGKHARGYAKSPDYDMQNLGQAIDDVRAALRQRLGKAHPRYAKALDAINEGYARYVRVERAAGQAGKDGVFSPLQYDRAVRALAGGARGGQAARGEALGQEFSSAGASRLPSQYPDSGTAGRMALMGGLGAGGLLVDPVHTGMAVAGLTAAGLPWLGPGRKAAEYLIARRPQYAQAIANMARGAGQLPGASAAAARLLQP